MERRCTGCGLTKPIDEFYRQYKGKEKRQSKCRTCVSEYAKKYTQWRMLEPITGTKVCPKCGIEKDRATEYAPGRHGYCRACAIQWKIKWAKENPDKRKKWRKAEHYRDRYGLEMADHDALMAMQEGRCALCKKDPHRLVVDHDHKTGVVRGLLCDPCNQFVGHLENKMGLLDAALAYIEGSEDLPGASRQVPPVGSEPTRGLESA